MKCVLLGLIITISVSINAQHQLPIKRISIFKNGTSLLLKEGKVSVQNGVAVLPVPTRALLGTYWLGASKEVPVKKIIFQNNHIKKKEPAKHIWEYLAGNIGAVVTLKLEPMGESVVITGKVLGVNQETQLVKIKQSNGKVTLLNAGKIQYAEFENEENPSFSKDYLQRLIVIKPEKEVETIALQEMYMQTGMNWIPSYQLRFKEGTKAELEMKATIENGAEEISEAETELVVGAPQMYFGFKSDPMTYEQLTTDITSEGRRYGVGAIQTLNSASAYRRDDMAETSFETPGEKNNDLYVYKIGRFSLSSQGKGNVSIFTTPPIEYKHQYEANIEDQTNYYNTRFCDSYESTVEVFHSIEFKNTTNAPFTTAPVMVVNEKNQFLAQDLLTYTPIGSKVNVKLAKAIDVVVKNAEEEVSRIDEAKRIGKIIYSKVIIKGKTTIYNQQPQEVNLMMRKVIQGNVIDQSDNGRVINKANYNNINQQAEIKWDLNLPINAQKNITYQYEVIFPR